MSYKFVDKQKSLKRRFLLILGVTTLVCLLVLAGMIMFWKSLPLAIDQTKRYIFGSIIVIYAILRFSRLLRKDDSEQ